MGQIIDTATDSDATRHRLLILRLTVTLRYAAQIIDTETDSDATRDRLLILRLPVSLCGTDYRY